MGDDERDPDRRAILSRRQRLIALALSGLGSTIGGCDEVMPRPCLEPMPIEQPVDQDPSQPSGGGPMLPDPTPPEPPPMPCLEPVYRPTDEPTTDEADEPPTEDPQPVERAPHPRPHPCLSRPRDPDPGPSNDDPLHGLDP